MKDEFREACEISFLEREGNAIFFLLILEREITYKEWIIQGERDKGGDTNS